VAHRRTHAEATEGGVTVEVPPEGEDCGDCNKCDKVDTTERQERKHDIRYENRIISLHYGAHNLQIGEKILLITLCVFKYMLPNFN
jgi:hypothetical protein